MQKHFSRFLTAPPSLQICRYCLVSLLHSLQQEPCGKCDRTDLGLKRESVSGRTTHDYKISILTLARLISTLIVISWTCIWFSFKKHSLCSSSHQRSEVQAVYPAKWYTSCGGRTQLWCKNWWSPLHSRCVCNICAFLKRKWFFLNLHTYIYLLNFNFFFIQTRFQGVAAPPSWK